jgi:hypothetical protein
LSTEYQSHSGAVNNGTSPKVQYAYADGSAWQIRPTSATYPDGRVITYDYGTANGTDNILRRVSKIKEGTNDRVTYGYLGLRVKYN